jgi:transcriptional antiterminator NusG
MENEETKIEEVASETFNAEEVLTNEVEINNEISNEEVEVGEVETSEVAASTSSVDETVAAIVEEAKQIAKQEREVLDASQSKDALWYAIHTFTGYENMAKINLETVIAKNKEELEKRIFEISIPEEEVIVESKGKRKLVKQKVMPGYVLIKMIYGDDIWHLVTKTKGITGFVGPNGRAMPLSDEEVRRLKLEFIRVEVDLAIGDKVQVLNGPLENMIGSVKAIDPVNQKVKVNVEMFGRETPVELEMLHIRKL